MGDGEDGGCSKPFPSLAAPNWLTTPALQHITPRDAINRRLGIKPNRAEVRRVPDAQRLSEPCRATPRHQALSIYICIDTSDTTRSIHLLGRWERLLTEPRRPLVRPAMRRRLAVFLCGDNCWFGMGRVSVDAAQHTPKKCKWQGKGRRAKGRRALMTVDDVYTSYTSGLYVLLGRLGRLLSAQAAALVAALPGHASRRLAAGRGGSPRVGGAVDFADGVATEAKRTRVLSHSRSC